MTTVSAVLVPYDETQPLQLVQIPQNPEEDLELWTRGLNSTVENIYDVRQRLLIRQTSSQSTEAAGLYACCVIPKHTPIMVAYKNVRATRLAMACGRFSISLYGNVLLIRSSLASRENLSVEEVYGPCCISPDLRKVLLTEIIMSSVSSTTISSDANFDIPSWLGNALQQNYHDASVLSKLATVMTGTAETGCSDDESDGDESDKNGDDIDDEREKQNNANETAKTTGAATKFVTKQPLCIYCRGPASKLCEGCQACYFCDAPRLCKALGWTHGCLCSTWRIYTERRNKLSAFSYLGDWTKALTAEAFYSSEQPYADFLLDQLGMSITTQQNGNGGSLDHAGSWWSTELHGWAAGQSQSAKSVDIFQRRSYAEGFAPLAEHDIPAQRPVHEQDFVGALLTKNAVGLWQLSSWEDYYRVRDLPPSSLAALLCTSPLTVYNGIVRYGEVPCTVARMLKRPLEFTLLELKKKPTFWTSSKRWAFFYRKIFEWKLHSYFVKICSLRSIRNHKKHPLPSPSCRYSCVRIFPLLLSVAHMVIL